MTRLSTIGANAALNGLDGTGTTNRMTHTGLHSADPGTTGASELAVTNYARQPTTWNGAGSSAKTNSNQLTFGSTPMTGPPSATNFGEYDAVSAGNYSIGGTLSPVTAGTIVILAGGISLGAT